MHRAGVDRAGRDRRRDLRLALQILAWDWPRTSPGISPNRSNTGRPLCVWRCWAVCGSTVMPHTGSLTPCSGCWCAPVLGIVHMGVSLMSRHDDPSLSASTLRGYRVDIYTPEGISQAWQNSKSSCLKRLSRIEGQVRGLARMVEEDRYCIDIVTQISAVRAALQTRRGGSSA